MRLLGLCTNVCLCTGNTAGQLRRRAVKARSLSCLNLNFLVWECLEDPGCQHAAFALEINPADLIFIEDFKGTGFRQSICIIEAGRHAGSLQDCRLRMDGRAVKKS